jgi:putative transcriptional regulator
MIVNSIRELRKGRKITQEELAIALQVTRQTIIAIEGFHYHPSLELGLKIAKFFRLPVEEIFTLKED